MNKKRIVMVAIILSGFVYAVTWSPSTAIASQPAKIVQTYCYPACVLEPNCSYFFGMVSCNNGGGGGNKKL